MRILFYIAMAITIIGILTTVTMMVVSFYDWVKELKRQKEWEKRLP